MRLASFAIGATLVAAASAVAAPAASAQVVTLDEGTFTVSRGPDRVGREDFSIRRTPGPEGTTVVVATATVINGDRRISPALRATAEGTPLAYQVDVQVAGETRERFRGQAGRGRFSATMRTPSGDSSKEYVVTDGALILDDDIFHQYYFLAKRAPGSGPVAVVVPRRNVQVAMTIESRGAESVTIGGQALNATRLAIREQGGTATRDVWIDAQGRVLRVRIADRNIEVLRDDPPR